MNNKKNRRIVTILTICDILFFFGVIIFLETRPAYNEDVFIGALLAIFLYFLISTGIHIYILYKHYY